MDYEVMREEYIYCIRRDDSDVTPLFLYSDTGALFYGNTFSDRDTFLFCEIVCLYVGVRCKNFIFLCGIVTEKMRNRKMRMPKHPHFLM